MLFHLSDFMSQMIDDLCPRDIWAWGLCILIIYHYIKQTSFMWSVHRSPYIPKKKQLQIPYRTELNSINCRYTKETIYHGFPHLSGLFGYDFDSNVPSIDNSQQENVNMQIRAPVDSLSHCGEKYSTVRGMFLRINKGVRTQPIDLHN